MMRSCFFHFLRERRRAAHLSQPKTSLLGRAGLAVKPVYWCPRSRRPLALPYARRYFPRRQCR